MSDAVLECEVLVIGGGPGGIAAAVTAAEAGRQVILVDDNPHAGGQIWRNQGHPHGPAARWLSRLAQAPRLQHLAGTRIVAPLSKNTLLAETPAGPKQLRFHSLILATGARELFLPFPGWTLPGVLGAGAIQALVKSGLNVRGKRILIAGTGPLLLAVAALLTSRGAIVPLIAEQTSAKKLRRFAFSLTRSPAKLLAAAAMRARLHRTRYALDSYITSVVPLNQSLRATLRSGTHNRTLDCDLLACGFNLLPNTELPQLLGCALTPEGFVHVDAHLRTTRPNIYAIGEVTGIGGIDKALLEGRLAALAAVGTPCAPSAQHQAALAFVQRLQSTFALRPELFTLAQPDTLICRCEDVSLAALTSSTNARDAKLQTRCGMGPCQGRTCGPILQHLLHAEPQLPRPPLFPTQLGSLANRSAEKADQHL
jgi:NADPH-dependent 2,4-dienoyl-CoA reductase/sulfur reductase-like enzyme